MRALANVGAVRAHAGAIGARANAGAVRARANAGAVLVVVLLVSLSVWLLLAGVLLVTRLQFEVAVATRDNAVARALAEQLIEERRADATWPPDSPGADDEGETGRCAWRVTLLDQSDPATTWYEAHVAYGRAQVTLDATIHRSLEGAAPAPAPP